MTGQDTIKSTGESVAAIVAERDRYRVALERIAAGDVEREESDLCSCEDDYDRYTIYCGQHGASNIAAAALGR